MNKIFTSFLLLLSIHTQAQKIHLKSGVIELNGNINKIVETQYANEITWKGYKYFILQFDRATSIQERNTISQQTGILFFDYVPRWAFIAALPMNTDLSSLSTIGIKNIIPHTYVYKTQKALLERPLPAYAMHNNKVIININVYPNVLQSDVNNFLANKNINIIQWQESHLLTIATDEANIENVCKMPFVKYISIIDPTIEYENNQARTNHRVNVLDSEYSTGFHYDGTGVSVAVGDDGGIGPHIDFKGRVINHPNNIAAGGTHGDHVCGIVGGAGNMDPTTVGNAKGADIHVYDDYGNITSANTHYNTQGVRITSNSLGQGCNAGYNNNAVFSDNLVNGKFSLLSVHSAGNSGGTTCGGVPQGFYTITGGYKAGKNVLAVGNLLKDDALAPSSSKGPSEDGRIKPDICGVGTNVNSTQPDNAYDVFTGTSMSCPGVAGTLATLWQAYRDTHAGNDPYSALMKALVLNTADDLGNEGPDFSFGFGRINARRALDVMNLNQFYIDSVDNGQTLNYQINVPVGTRLAKFMLYWSDPAGNPANSIVLVNDLDITVTDPNNNVIRPWVLNNAPNVAALTAPAVRTRDSINNVEQVTIPNLTPGTFSINIIGKDVPQGPQKFVLTYEITAEPLIITYPQGGEHFVPGVQERVRWDGGLGNSLQTLEYSSDAGANWITVANNIPATQKYYNWTPPVVATGQMLLRITKGALTDVSDTLFSIIGVPTGLTVDTACGSTFHLIWNPVTNANAYRIYQLGTKYMQEIGTSTTTDFYINTGVNTTDTFYFAVAALETNNGAVGRRCNAYRKLPGEVNCLDDLYNVETTLPFTKVYNCASSGVVPVTIKLKNIGVRNVTNIPVYYQVNAQPIVSEIIPITLVVGDSTVYTFTNTVNMLNAGTYNVKTWVHSNADINNLNDTSMATAIVLAPVNMLPPAIETFESPLFPPTGWSVYNYDNSVKWQKTFCLNGAVPGNTHAAYMDHFNYNAKGQIDELESALFDLTGVTTDSALITFDIAHAYGPLDPDTLSLWVSVNCNNNFVPLPYKKWGNDLASVGMMNNIFPPTLVSDWKKDQADLSAYKGQRVFVRFRAHNNKGNNIYIDNVNILLKNVTPLSTENIQSNALRIYPNPSTGIFAIEMNSQKAQQVLYKVYDIAGNIVINKAWDINKGKQSQLLDISTLANGFYTLNILVNGEWQNAKLIKSSIE